MRSTEYLLVLFVSSVCIVKCSVYLAYRLIFITVYMSITQ